MAATEAAASGEFVDRLRQFRFSGRRGAMSPGEGAAAAPDTRIVSSLLRAAESSLLLDVVLGVVR
jgi:hypothetical protein